MRRLTVVGRVLAANGEARAAYATMARDRRVPWPHAVERGGLGAVRWPAAAGRAQGAGDAGLSGERGVAGNGDGRVSRRIGPVAAICHGVLLAARSKVADGSRSVLHGRRTTALTWALERTAARVGRIARFWDPWVLPDLWRWGR